MFLRMKTYYKTSAEFSPIWPFQHNRDYNLVNGIVSVLCGYVSYPDQHL